MMSRSRSQTRRDPGITRQDAAEIGARFRTVRGTANQTQFAERLGISREQLSRIESGAQVPGTATFRRLARVARVSVDFVMLGADVGEPRAATAEGPGWEAALEPLLGGTTLRLSRSPASGRKIDRAWQELSEERREEIRAFVRRVALVAVATEALLPAKAARAVTDQLGTELTAVVADRILAAS
jgi:transcriptional regulator with XRE-family HTH domain